MTTTASEFSDSLLADFTKLLVDANDYDVLIKVGGGHGESTSNSNSNAVCIKAHSCILRARSPYFHSALSSRWKKIIDDDDNGGNYIIFEKPNISPDVFQIILRYIYIGKISLEKLDPIFTLDILTAANELILQELEASVISFFTRHHVNWIKNHPLQLLFHTVFKLESCHKIQQLCLDNICNDPDIVFNSSISKSINESILLQLLKRDDLRMNEIKLLDYLIQWGVTNLDINCNDGNVVDSVSNWTQNEFDALDSILKNCIGNIRFENINHNKQQIYRRSPSHKFKLLLRGSRDDFTAKTFHNLCDNKGATVVVMKDSITGEIIGGYNPVGWTGGFYGNWIMTDETQENNNNPKISRIIPKNSKMAIFCADIRGPCFGGNDLCMSNMNNLNKDCTSNLTYYDSDVIKSNKFDVLDYEVFQLQMWKMFCGTYGDMTRAGTRTPKMVKLYATFNGSM
ncbi:3783_t:CDS:2 [Entrophospora sp. SA101]|nr:3783_t:CDS:2 [Entrophospora sp. SA101]